MPHEIVLSTLNARYAHCAFGLRYLHANLGALRDRAIIAEFDISQRSLDVAESILANQPRIVGLGVYVWNATQSLQLVSDLKRLDPSLIIVLGGPEVSYETDEQPIARLADYVITGEADVAFAELCTKLLTGTRPLMKIIAADLPDDLSTLASPYPLYDERDVAHRVVYIEASRGCPFRCEFCLSSLDVPVRNFPLDAFLSDMQSLLDRGLRQFKFVDRTFNLNLNHSASILRFFLDRLTPDLFLHFEMIPDRLPDALRSLIEKFPPGTLQFEVGIQTFNEEIADRISRRQDAQKVEDNLRWLRNHTGVHVHADLIVGLPGESIDSFAQGFDRLVNLQPQEIQVGILKRLRGTPIIRHDEPWGMVYSDNPPYEILRTSVIDFPTMQRLRRFARYWDLIANSGNFTLTAPLLWHDGASPFSRFLALSDWLFERAGRSHAIALPRLFELMFEFLTTDPSLDRAAVARSLWSDYTRSGRSDLPPFLKGFDLPTVPRAPRPAGAPKRQARHLA